MARRVQVVLEDDVDGGDAAETVSFALDGRSYEIDLNSANAAALREALAPWIAAGRRAGAAPTAGRTPARARTTKRSEDTADIRRWAVDNGLPVSSRGRISSDLRARYEAAHK